MRLLASSFLVFLAACGNPPPGLDAGLDAGADSDAGADTGQDGGSDAGCGSELTPREGTVLTTAGAVTGVAQGDVWAWLGIPFAEPPTGGLRWRPPVPRACWTGERAATSFGAVCPQLEPDGGYLGDEDCLSLNVWAKKGESKAPVLFFIHGGGNTQGSPSDPLYDGRALASRQGAVVVTASYRLGALGFFTHSGLDAESDAGVSGNYGVLDQQAALGWVRDNIARFGGDPSRVLVFGESAGGQDTLLHLVSPRSKGLFSAALVESGGVYDGTLAQSEQEMQQVVAAVGCQGLPGVLGCLRSRPAEVLARVPAAIGPFARGLAYRPVIDGVVIPENPRAAFEGGRHHQVPLVIGTNAEETSRMVPLVQTPAEYASAVRAQYGDTLGNQLLTQYPASRFATPRQALIALTTDALWTCPARRLARAIAAHQQEPVYRYFFTWRASAAGAATHGLELPFVFRTFSAWRYTPDATATALSDAIQGYWSRLAVSGDPNGAGAFTWPRYDPQRDNTLELGAALAVLPGVRTADCDFLDAL